MHVRKFSSFRSNKAQLINTNSSKQYYFEIKGWKIMHAHLNRIRILIGHPLETLSLLTTMVWRFNLWTQKKIWEIDVLYRIEQVVYTVNQCLILYFFCSFIYKNGFQSQLYAPFKNQYSLNSQLGTQGPEEGVRIRQAQAFKHKSIAKSKKDSMGLMKSCPTTKIRNSSPLFENMSLQHYLH